MSPSRWALRRSAPTSAVTWTLGIAPVIADYAAADPIGDLAGRRCHCGILIYAIAGLVIFGGFTIVDFNRLRSSTPDAAVPIAAGIFLDVLNIFVLALDLFGGRRD